MKLRLAEPIFYSIQGEGIHAGIPTIFIRLAGCNLRCRWCDTSYAQGTNPYLVLEIDKFLPAITQLDTRTFKRWVCITGGEPLTQEQEVSHLVRSLKRWGFLTEIASNGSLPRPDWWTLVDSWAVDIKCPSSGMESASLEDWFNSRPGDQLKFVIGSSEDMDFASKTILNHPLRNPTVVLSPVISLHMEKVGLPMHRLQEVVELAKSLNVRFSLQLHKVIWGNKRGV